MKYENLLLRGLFLLCMLLCVTAFGSMLFGITHAAPAHRITVATSAAVLAPMPCPLLPDGVLCMRAD